MYLPSCKVFLFRCGFIFYTLFLFPSCKTLHLNNVCKLPNVLDESSGLIIPSSNHFWSHNDSGGEPELYETDSTGRLTRTLRITNAVNKDWEEITMDKADNFYIGDFGNNASKRRDLTIYKIKKFSKIIGDSVTAEKINFKYEDQFDYPPEPKFKYFDAEAMLVMGDSIYIFTKDFYTNPYSGKSRVYVVPNSPGNYTARLVKILETDKSSHWNGAITGAAMSDDGTIVLLTYNKLFVTDMNHWVSSVETGKINESIPEKQYVASVFSFGKTQFAQREGVAFAPHSNTRLYLTSERSLPFSGHLSTVTIKQKAFITLK